jgi:opacity protein-like surface antigen
MKKKILIVTFALLGISTFSLRADIRVGVKGGLNLSKAAFTTNAIKSDNFTGFQVGPILELSSASGFGIDAAVLYSQQGLKIKKFSLVEKVSTLDVPVNLKLKFSVLDQTGIYLAAGPYASFKVDDKTTISAIKTQWKMKKFGAGLNFGAGLELFEHLQVGINYQIALNEDYGNILSAISNHTLNVNKLQAKTRIWSINAAIFF